MLNVLGPIILFVLAAILGVFSFTAYAARDFTMGNLFAVGAAGCGGFGVYFAVSAWMGG